MSEYHLRRSVSSFCTNCFQKVKIARSSQAGHGLERLQDNLKILDQSCGNRQVVEITSKNFFKKGKYIRLMHGLGQNIKLQFQFEEDKVFFSTLKEDQVLVKEQVVTPIKKQLIRQQFEKKKKPPKRQKEIKKEIKEDVQDSLMRYLSSEQKKKEIYKLPGPVFIGDKVYSRGNLMKRKTEPVIHSQSQS